MCILNIRTLKVNNTIPPILFQIKVFVWQPDEGNFGDDLGKYWEEIIRYLSSPVKHSLESFILQEDHEVIRTFREALHGPPGR